METIATGNYENLSNEEYWIERSLEVSDEKFNDLKVVEKELQLQYKIALDDIQKELQAFYTKYADENGLTYAQAKQTLTSYEISNYKARMESLQRQFQNGNQFALIEIERLVKQMQHDRLQSLFFQIDSRLIELAGSQQMTFEDLLAGTYESTFYQTAYSVALGTGVGISFSKINEDFIKEAITYPWSGDMFSNRIWSNRNQLVKQIRETITNGLIKGSSVQKMAREIKGTMDSSYKNSLRLIRTETAAVIGDATAKSYENLDVEEYQFIATLDNRTSNTCSTLDGKVFKLKDKQVGVNYPPMHPNCRSAVAPYFSNRKQAELRRSRDSQNNNEVIPNMTFNEWQNKYVK